VHHVQPLTGGSPYPRRGGHELTDLAFPEPGASVPAAFAVVVPAFNAERTIGAAIESALAQTRGDFELVVVDDGSTDATAARAAVYMSDGRVKIVSHENRGLGAARATGIAATSAPLVSLLDSDDLWMPTYLQRVGAALEEQPEAALAYCDAWVIDDDTRRVWRKGGTDHMRPPERPPAAPAALLRELVERNFVFGLVTMRRSALADVGSFRPDLRAAEDYELWLRLAASGHSFVRVRERLAVYRRRGDSLSADSSLIRASRREVFRLVAEEYPDVPDEVRARARELMLKHAPGNGGGSRRSAASKRALIRLAVRARRRLAPGRVWYPVPPPELRTAFPDLFQP
jgi:glycosyltransferase involved in cell wall biosynthesis